MGKQDPEITSPRQLDWMTNEQLAALLEDDASLRDGKIGWFLNVAMIRAAAERLRGLTPSKPHAKIEEQPKTVSP